MADPEGENEALPPLELKDDALAYKKKLEDAGKTIEDLRRAGDEWTSASEHHKAIFDELVKGIPEKKGVSDPEGEAAEAKRKAVDASASAAPTEAAGGGSKETVAEGTGDAGGQDPKEAPPIDPVVLADPPPAPAPPKVFTLPFHLKAIETTLRGTAKVEEVMGFKSLACSDVDDLTLFPYPVPKKRFHHASNFFASLFVRPIKRIAPAKVGLITTEEGNSSAYVVQPDQDSIDLTKLGFVHSLGRYAVGRPPADPDAQRIEMLWPGLHTREPAGYGRLPVGVIPRRRINVQYHECPQVLMSPERASRLNMGADLFAASLCPGLDIIDEHFVDRNQMSVADAVTSTTQKSFRIQGNERPHVPLVESVRFLLWAHPSALFRTYDPDMMIMAHPELGAAARAESAAAAVAKFDPFPRTTQEPRRPAILRRVNQTLVEGMTKADPSTAASWLTGYGQHLGGKVFGTISCDELTSPADIELAPYAAFAWFVLVPYPLIRLDTILMLLRCILRPIVGMGTPRAVAIVMDPLAQEDAFSAACAPYARPVGGGMAIQADDATIRRLWRVLREAMAVVPTPGNPTGGAPPVNGAVQHRFFCVKYDRRPMNAAGAYVNPVGGAPGTVFGAHRLQKGYPTNVDVNTGGGYVNRTYGGVGLVDLTAYARNTSVYGMYTPNVSDALATEAWAPFAALWNKFIGVWMRLHPKEVDLQKLMTFADDFPEIKGRACWQFTGQIVACDSSDKTRLVGYATYGREDINPLVVPMEETFLDFYGPISFIRCGVHTEPDAMSKLPDLLLPRPGMFDNIVAMSSAKTTDVAIRLVNDAFAFAMDENLHPILQDPLLAPYRRRVGLEVGNGGAGVIEKNTFLLETKGEEIQKMTESIYEMWYDRSTEGFSLIGSMFAERNNAISQADHPYFPLTRLYHNGDPQFSLLRFRTRAGALVHSPFTVPTSVTPPTNRIRTFLGRDTVARPDATDAGVQLAPFPTGLTFAGRVQHNDASGISVMAGLRPMRHVDHIMVTRAAMERYTVWGRNVFGVPCESISAIGGIRAVHESEQYPVPVDPRRIALAIEPAPADAAQRLERGKVRFDPEKFALWARRNLTGDVTWQALQEYMAGTWILDEVPTRAMLAATGVQREIVTALERRPELIHMLTAIGDFSVPSFTQRAGRVSIASFNDEFARGVVATAAQVPERTYALGHARRTHRMLKALKHTLRPVQVVPVTAVVKYVKMDRGLNIVDGPSFSIKLKSAASSLIAGAQIDLTKGLLPSGVVKFTDGSDIPIVWSEVATNIDCRAIVHAAPAVPTVDAAGRYIPPTWPGRFYQHQLLIPAISTEEVPADLRFPIQGQRLEETTLGRFGDDPLYVHNPCPLPGPLALNGAAVAADGFESFNPGGRRVKFYTLHGEPVCAFRSYHVLLCDECVVTPDTFEIPKHAGSGSH